MNKSFITNLISIIIILLGVIFSNNIILTIGLFSLSGAITNWLAIHMLFEKVPFLYGSGVVENRFDEFKKSIHNLIMVQFFTKENLQKFFDDEIKDGGKKFDFRNIIEKTDFSLAFINLKQTVIESPFGGMLAMVGGEKALDPLKEPFEKKIKNAINEIVHTDGFQKELQKSLQNSDIHNQIYDKINIVVENRLNELTPRMVKELVEEMIKEHLGWLVVWGGVFGGVIGAISGIIL